MKKRFLFTLLLGCLSLAAAFPDFERPESWRKSSSGSLTITRDEAEKALRFDVTFPPDKDFWAYPEAKLQGGIPATVKYLTFEIKIEQQNPEAGYKCAYVMFGKGGKASWKPSLRRQRVVIDLDEAKIDRNKAETLCIGANPKSPGMTFYLSKVEFLEKLPETGPAVAEWVETAAPATLFTDGQKPEFTVKKSYPGLTFEVLDRHDRAILSGPVPEAGKLTLAPLPRGYYRLRLQAPGREFQGERSFAVIPDPAKRRLNPDSPYAVDAALSVIGTVSGYERGNREKGMRFFVKLARLAGVEFARERIHQNSETAPGVYDWTFYAAAPRLFAEAGIRLTATWHNSAPWALAGKEDKLPRDLMTAYSFGKKLAETFKGQVQVWEFWNEPELPGFCTESAWEFAAMSKAAYLGFKAGAPEIPVTNGSFCQMPKVNIFAEAVLANDLAGYFDLFNFHIYQNLDTYPGQIDDWRAILRKHGAPMLPIWVTENGTNGEGVATLPTKAGNNLAQTPEQEMVWAEFIPKGQLLLQSLGVTRTFVFVLPPMNERDGKKDWGMVRRDYTAKPAFVSFATLTDQLAAAEYLGQPETPSGIRAFLFRQPDGAHTLAFWSESELDRTGDALSGNEFRRELTVPLKTSGTLTDIFGTPETVKPEKGLLRLTSTRYPAYLTGDFTLPVKTPPVNPGAAGSGFHELDKSIVLRVIPAAGFTLASQRNLLLIRSEVKERKLKLQAANFSNETKRGQVTVEGGEISGLPPELELKPFEVKELGLELPASLPLKLHNYRFGGVFNGLPISRLELPVLPFSAKEGKLLAGSDRAEKWRANSSGKLEISQEGEAVRFDVTFPPNVDRWVYPEFLPEESLKGVIGISFEIKTEPMPKPFKSLIMLVEGKDKETGKSFNLPYLPSAGEWQENFISIKLDSPEAIKQLRIGMNPHVNRATFRLRNLRIHRQ